MYSDDNTIRIWSMDRDRAMKQRTETYAMDEYEISDGEEEEDEPDAEPSSDESSLSLSDS